MPIAQSLAAMGIPFLFLTGYPVAYLPLDMRARSKLDKPFQPRALVECLDGLVASRGKV